MRVIVSGLGSDGGEWELPGAIIDSERVAGGGERSLCELAVAVAATGREVELRGLVNRRMLDELSAAAGARPILAASPRRPARDDLVILPEGHIDPRVYANIMLSEARGVLLLLAPPGLFGWPFVSDWTPPDPLSVPLDKLARAEHFRGMAACGFELWTNSEGLAAAASSAGIACAFIGVGWPAVLPAPAGKETDVAMVGFNRWAPLATGVLERLDVSHDIIPAMDHNAFLQRLGRARILVWPSRIEGWARIQCEARALGTIPVALKTNLYAAGLNEECGAVLADSLDEMPAKIRELLGDGARLERLARSAVASARRQTDWSSHVRRVDAALSAVEKRPADDGIPARAAMGAAVATQETAERKALAREAALLRHELSRSGQYLGAFRAAGFRRTAFEDVLRLFLRCGCVRPLVRLARRSRTRYRRPPLVLVAPAPLDNPSYTIRLALERLGAEIHNRVDPRRVYDLVLGWHDSNWQRTPGMTRRPLPVCLDLAAVLREAVGRKYWNCSLEIDVSKTALGEAFRAAFGRALTIDPRAHRGQAVEKSDENATHDGRVVTCPLEPAPSKVYQVFVDSNDSRLRHWRIAVADRRPVVVVERTVEREHRFAAGAAGARLVELDDALSADELERIRGLCDNMEVDYCEMDALRDADDKLWIVDVNPTPCTSARGIPDAKERERAIARHAEVLSRILI